MSANLIQIQNLSKSYGARSLFNGVSLSVNEDEHIGVIGPNGAGKTTLFKILVGTEEVDSGQVIRSRDLRLGYLSQHDDWDLDQSGNEFLELKSQVPLWELKAEGRQLQLDEMILSRPIRELSGGYRMRIKLLALLGQRPNLMLLDEPTNYLDLETTLVIERFLQGYRGSFLLISHDREFLRRTTDHTLEIEAGEFTKYNGNLDDYFEQKNLLREQLESRAEALDQKRKTILDFVNRFGAKATKARQAQSRLKSLEKMEKIDLKPLPTTARIRIPEPLSTGKKSIEAKKLALGYENKVVIQAEHVMLNRGDHLAVIGMNGAGKSTLLKALAGVLKPISGTIEWGHGIYEIGYFHQHVAAELDTTKTVYECLEQASHTGISPQQILDLAGSLLFSGDAVRKPVRVLSGGERSRVALGQILLKRAPILILDEPTNHLDFETVEALTTALQAFPGTVIFVSHDRSFVRRLGTKILEVSNGTVRVYPGEYDDYVWSLERSIQAQETDTEKTADGKASAIQSTADTEPKSKNQWAERKENEKQKRALARKIDNLEEEIESLTAEIKELNERLIAETPNHPEFQSWVKRLSTQGERLQIAETEWLEATDLQSQNNK